MIIRKKNTEQSNIPTNCNLLLKNKPKRHEENESRYEKHRKSDLEKLSIEVTELR